MNELISISNPTQIISGTIELPGSKSESNRVLIINALSRSTSEIHNLSSSHDTKVLQEALVSKNETIDIHDAGTTMRFLTAYYSATKQNKIISGSARMKERPVKALVDALNSIGASIEYIGQTGFPPLKINGSLSSFQSSKIKIPAQISSQFISAILMIAPLLPSGLEIELEGKISSMPYISMTLGIMKHFGITYQFTGSTIRINKQDYIPTEFSVESDWSSASYWYSMVALSQDAAVFLKGLKRNSLQGDSIIKDMMLRFGVITEFSDTGAFITKGNVDTLKFPDTIDFSDFPDLAQTIIVLCAAKGIKCRFSGLESLRIKETDRIKALQQELIKFDVSLSEGSNNTFSLDGVFNSSVTPVIETYNDHRMAMAFAPLSLLCRKIFIKEPSCVIKSYRGFWDDMNTAGFITE